MGYDQAKAFGNKESGQSAYMNYVGAAGGWGGAMVEDNIYQTSPYMDAEGCYEMTFVDPKDLFLLVGNRLQCRWKNVQRHSEYHLVKWILFKTKMVSYTIRFGCEGQPNNIPIREGNTTGKFNILMRHYNPSKEVSNNEPGYDATKFIKPVK